MLAERRSSPSPSPSCGISIGSRISAIGARLSRRSSNAGDSQQNKSEDQDSISPILGRTGECFHEIYGGVVVVVRVHVRLMSESEIRDKKVWATLSSLLIGALIFAPCWRTQRFTPDAPLRSHSPHSLFNQSLTAIPTSQTWNARFLMDAKHS